MPSDTPPFGQTPLALVVCAWLLTYGIHSTLLLGSTWLLDVRSIVRSNPLKDLLWKLALVGGLITATFQVAGPITPLGGRLAFLGSRAPAQIAEEQTGQRLGATGEQPNTIANFDQNSSGSPGQTITDARFVAAAQNARAGRQPIAFSWADLLLGLWLASTALALARLGVRRRRLYSSLGLRREIVSGPLPDIIARLCRSAGVRRRVRLTCSALIASPIAIGCREICLPERAVDRLSLAQQESMLAHELAHVIRRDPAWLWVVAVIESVCFFQPLNRLARRRSQEVAEYLCDDWAVQQTGAPLTLAQCLSEVATWVAAVPRLSDVSSMVGGSPLTRRVQRLLDARYLAVAEAPRRLWGLLAAGLLLCVGCGAPGVSVVPRDGTDPLAIDRGRIVFSSERDGASDLYIMDPAGTSIRRLRTNQFDPSLAVWSPDGGRVAFNAGRWPTTDIYVIDADGDNLRRLTSDGAQNAHPSWSPDGKRIAFVSARDGNLELYVMSADGNDIRRLTYNQDEDHKPAWSPDGARIAFSSKHDGNVDIYLIDADGGKARRLTDHSATDMNPAWSIDGKQIAFNSNRSGNMELYVMDAAGGNVRRLLRTNPGAWDEKPSWSPDGAQIVFFSNRDGNPDIYVIGADGANLRRLTADNASFDGLPVWSPVSRAAATTP